MRAAQTSFLLKAAGGNVSSNLKTLRKLPFTTQGKRYLVVPLLTMTLSRPLSDVRIRKSEFKHQMSRTSTNKSLVKFDSKVEYRDGNAIVTLPNIHCKSIRADGVGSDLASEAAEITFSTRSGWKIKPMSSKTY